MLEKKVGKDIPEKMIYKAFDGIFTKKETFKLIDLVGRDGLLFWPRKGYVKRL